MAARLRITQVKSTISHIARNRATIRALGLRGIGDSVEVADNDATRGMVRQVSFLVTVDEVSDAAPERAERATTKTAERRGTGGASSTEPSDDGADAQETE